MCDLNLLVVIWENSEKIRELQVMVNVGLLIKGARKAC